MNNPLIKKYSILLFLGTFFATSYFFQGGNPNANSRFNLMRSIAEEQTFTIDQFQKNTIDISKVGDHYYSDKAPGQAFVGALILWTLNPIIDLLPLSKNPEARARLQLYLIEVFLLSLPSAIACVMFFQLLISLPHRPKLESSFLISFLTYFATILLPYNTVLFSHGLSASLLVATLWGIRQLMASSSKIPLAAWTLAVAVPYIGIVEYTLLPLALLSFMYLCFFQNRHFRVYHLIPSLSLCVLQLYYNDSCFGSPFALGYQSLESQIFHQGMSKGLFGVSLPNPQIIVELLLGSFRGLFYYSPILWLAVFAIPYVYKKNRAILGVCLGVFGYLLLLNSGYTFWSGGSCIGPRHLIASIPFLGLLLSYLPRSILWSPLIFAISGVSMLFAIATTAVSTIPGEHLTNPLWQYFIPSLQAGRLSHGGFNLMNLPYSVSAPDTYWAAFNLGELLGLQGQASLAPYFLINLVLIAPPISSGVKIYLISLIKIWRHNSHKLKVQPIFYACSFGLLIFLAMQYPLHYSANQRITFRPFLDLIDIEVYLQRGTWLYLGLKPFVDVFCEYPIVAAFIFGSFRFVSASPWVMIVGIVSLQGLAFLLWIKTSSLRHHSWLILLGLALPATWYFGFSRFDLLVGILLGVYGNLILQKKIFKASLTLILLFWLKWTPALLALPTLLYLAKIHKRGLIQFVGFNSVLLITSTLMIYLWLGFDGIMVPIQWQMSRIPGDGSFIQHLGIISQALGLNQELMPKLATILQFLIPIALPLIVIPKNKISLLFMFLAVLNGFIAFSKVYSPQWIIWETFLWIPLLVILKDEGRVKPQHLVAFIVPNLISYLWFPLIFDATGPNSLYTVWFGMLLSFLRFYYLYFLVKESKKHNYSERNCQEA